MCSPELKMKSSPVKRVSSDSDNGDVSPAPKIPKMSHFFKCKQCSYGTNQLTELEHHMIQHSPGVPPSTAERSPNQGETIPYQTESTYCADCNIQFTSLKTYQGHKEIYCKERHRKSASSTGRASEQTSPRMTTSHEGLLVEPSPWISPTVMSSPQVVPPIIMPYPLPCPLPLQQVTKPVSSGTNEEKPLDLSVKKNEEVVRNGKNGICNPGIISRECLSRKRPGSEFSPGRSSIHEISPTICKSEPKKESTKKCISCNIEFSTHEVYMIHKAEYCSKRDPVVTDDKPLLSPTKLSPERLLPISSQTSLPLIPPHLLPQHYLRFYCNHCNIKFSSKDNLQAHLQFYCPMKNEKQINGHLTPSPKPMDNHTVTSPKSPKGKACEHCGDIYYSSDLLSIHTKICQPSLANFSLFNCPYCKFISYSENQLMDHIKCHMATKYYCCRVCGYRGNTLRGMKMHGKVHAENDERFNFEYDVEEIETDPKQEASKSGNSSDGDENEVDNFINFVNLREKYKHLILTPPILNGLALHRPAPHLCFMCNETFSDMTKLRDHMRVHSVEDTCKNYVCKYCEFGCSSKTDLVRHVKIAHETRSRKNSQENGDTQGENHEINTPVVENLSEKVEQETPCYEENDTNISKYESKENDEALIKEEKTEENLVDVEKDSTVASPLQAVKPLLVQPIAPLSPVTDNIDSAQNNMVLMKTDKSSPQYCKQCDITFMYYSTFVAHKKYYCASHVAEKNVA